MQILVMYYPRNKNQVRLDWLNRLLLVAWLILAYSVLLVDLHTPLLTPLRTSLLKALTPLGWGPHTLKSITRTVSHQTRSKQSLQVENTVLKQKKFEAEASLQAMDALKDENATLRTLLQAKDKVNKEGRLAFVKQNVLTSFSQQLLLQEGSAEGILPGQAVIDERGIVGLVLSSTPQEATVLLMTDPNQGLPVKNARTNVRMIARGAGRFDRLSVSHLAKTMDIQLGDTILTSGVGGHFPEGYPVGLVVNVQHNKKDPFVTVMVEPFSKLADLSMVFVLKDEHP